MPEHLQGVLCTAVAVVEGGREGHGRSLDVRLDADLSAPESMGGSGGPGTNPEELFAVGYAACFQSPLLSVATGRRLDTSTKSNCNGTRAQNWPPVKGPATASGVTGTFGTIKRSDGSAQATFDGHPLYTFVGDTAPGQAKGNGLNALGGLWHEITTSGTAPAGSSTSGSGGGGSGY
jgi:organic hydroperoxide reductase OsmC/OhrA